MPKDDHGQYEVKEKEVKEAKEKESDHREKQYQRHWEEQERKK